MTRNVRIALIGGATFLGIFALSPSSGDSYDGYGSDGGYEAEGYGYGPQGPGGMQQPGYGGGMQQPGYGGGMQQPGYNGGMQQPGYNGGMQTGYDGGMQAGYGGGAAPGYGGGMARGYDGGSAGDMQMESWQRQQASNDEMHRRTINGINGTADVMDSQTGEVHYGVDGSSGAYWSDPTSGSVVGTGTYDSNPDVSTYNSATNMDDVYSGGE
jgi:hypothetical protein